ncbi:Outer membrane efflux protein [Magnetospirillum gryphiswaldense MSR-1 v2]|uniref:Outer membrane efflux protein n=1 Tax=Magnetospirillum gryphiswaldense (strain DSM 6361 / JCM 21280 / NBRC 15271 / MSR-1) TaxID=431944 RepID=V6F2N0_MAGGM|nr:TolC family protein [Magnetospirillum gryphiswaldense]CDK99652.1 Outer membrane efflux protein [Magnetospirillum gryphiswaldense MSR-1 v2]
MTVVTTRMARLLAAVSTAALLSACAVTPTPFTADEFSARAKADRAAMFEGQEVIAKPLTLADAVARVLKYNLDKRAKMMEEALALGQTSLDRFDLLPKLTANAGYTERSEPNATRSRDLYTQTTSTSNPSYSADRFSVTSDLGLTWNILDFGVSYFTAHQNADRALIASERRRKTINNLVQEVRFTFWRAAAAQTLKAKVTDTITSAEKALKDSEKVEGERLKNPIESLRIQKTLLESIRQLEAIDQELTSAKAELAALINVAPGSDFKLDVPANGGMSVPEWPMDIGAMEQAAMINNPDLREQDYQSRIALDDTHKEILKLLPGITVSFSRQYDSNSFLVDNRWNDVGTKVTWNLINLLAAPDRMAHADSAEKVVEAKRIALRMAVLAQVHVVSHQFASAAKQFERADKLWGIEKRLADAAGNQSRGGTVNEIERISTETSAIAAELRRFQTYAQMQSSYGKLQSTIGADPVPEKVASHSLDGLSGAIVLSMPPAVKADPAPVTAPEVQAAAAEPEREDVVRDGLFWLGRKIAALAEQADSH